MSQAPRREQANGGPPPGQGYYNAYSEASGYDDRFQQGPQPHREAGYVPYQDSYASFDRMPANSQNPRDQYGYSSPPPRDGYGDSERGYSERAFSDRPPPPSDYGRRPPYDDRYYDDRDSRYDDRDYDRDYDRRRRRRSRRYSDDDLRQKALRYPSDPKKGGRDVFGASDGERGMGAQLLGGAAGALLGHKFADGALGTVGGAVLGAIASGAAERHYEKRKEEKVYKRRSLDDGYTPVQYPPPGHDMDDVRRTGRDGRTGIRERLRSMSRGATARFRSRSRPRRSPSLESDERYHYR